jgi:hypothetical protein
MEMSLTILSLLLAIIGLIALKPSLTITPLSPTDPAQPFSVPFQITNNSFYPIYDVTIYGYMHKIRVGGLTAQRNLLSRGDWKAKQLGRDESVTIITNFIRAPILPAEADIAVVIYYKLFRFPFIKLHRFIRFVGHFGVNWQWLQQPSNDIRGDAMKMIKESRIHFSN